MLTVRIDYDSDLECPNDFDGWQLHSFNTRHNNYTDPDSLDIKAIKRKLKSGLAFWLDYYEHGNCIWTLEGDSRPGMEFTWDGRHKAGILIWEQDSKNLGPKSYEDRAKDASGFLETYTCWANGEGYWYSIEDEHGTLVDSCGGFYGNDTDYMLQEIAEHVAGNEFEVTGDGCDYLENKLRKLAEKTPDAGRNPLAFL